MVIDGDHKRRFDIVLYVNGLPLGVIELKKAGDENAGLEGAHAQVMTYVEELPLAFRCNVACVVSDGIRAKYGTAFTPFEHFAPWNVDDEGKPVPQPGATDADLAINLLLYGLFEQRRFIEILGGYVAFAQSDGGLVKRIAKPHQYFAVSKAVRKTLEAVRSNGHAGVVWHTQGSGKSHGDGVVREPGAAAPLARQPDDRRAHRPHRPRRPALRDVRGQRAAARGAAAGRDPRPVARRTGQAAERRHPVHHAAEVRPDQGGAGVGAAAPAAVGPAQHHRRSWTRRTAATTTT